MAKAVVRCSLSPGEIGFPGLFYFRPVEWGQRKEGLSLRHILGLLLMILGLSSLAGGLGFLAAPDGSVLRIPVEWLYGTPFVDYFWPGFILTLQALLALFVGVGVWFDPAGKRWKEWNPFPSQPWWAVGTALSGTLLLGWLAIEAYLLSLMHWLQTTYTLLALLILGAALMAARGQGKLRDAYREINVAGFLRLTPFVLPLIMTGVFATTVKAWGFPSGFLAAYLLYWAGVFLFSLWALGLEGHRLKTQLKPAQTTKNGVWILLALPVIAAWSFRLPMFLEGAAPLFLVPSLLFLAINAYCEEIFWRGSYLACFPKNPRWALFGSSAGFALWHAAPLTVLSNGFPGGALTFIGFQFCVGFFWGFAARSQKTLRWVFLAHVLMDLAGLRAILY